MYFAHADHPAHRRCHLGRSIIYDTVTELSWAVDIRTHGIVNVIENVLNKTWKPSEAEGREVPVAKAEDDCVVSSLCYCRNFSYIDVEPVTGMLQLGVWQLFEEVNGRQFHITNTR